MAWSLQVSFEDIGSTKQIFPVGSHRTPTRGWKRSTHERPKLQKAVDGCDSLWVSASTSLTLTAAAVGRELVPGLTGASVAAQRVDAALLTLAVVRTGALVHLWSGFKGIKQTKKKNAKVILFVSILCVSEKTEEGGWGGGHL